MKIPTYIIDVIALAIGIFNLSKINFDSPLKGDSFTALITAIAAGCAILIVTVLRVSKKIDNLSKKG